MLKHALVLGSAVTLFACGGESTADTNGSGGTSSGGTSSGGTSSGGSSSGGTSSGGTSSGGTSSGGTGGSTATGMVGECKVDADCELQTSCCECLAGKKGTVTLGPCDAVPCEQSACGELGVTEARCIAGQCTIAANCNINTATCKSLPPKCPSGTTVTVNATGCWGPCLPHQSCAEVKDCFECPAGNICVVNEAFGSTHHCVNPNPNCGGGCQCLEPLVCINGFTLCNEFDDGSAAHCECPNC